MADAPINRTLYAADCLDVLNNENQLPDESVDLIYLDPPFNSESNYNLPFKGREKEAYPVEAFTDTWHWRSGEDNAYLQDLHADPRSRSLANIIQFARDEEIAQMSGGGGGRRKRPVSLASYLLNMGRRLRAMRRVLKPTGSIYLHCDPTCGHYLKLLMDTIFGRKNFRNEVIWHYYNKYSAGRRVFGRNFDMILFYSKHDNYKFNPLRIKRDEPRRQLVRENVGGVLKNKRDKDGNLMYRTVVDKKLDAVWTIPCLQPASKERLGYPTQKPLALLERIIRASSDEGDLVLDPFCGCGTTVHAAESLGRRWLGIDISPFSTGLIRERLLGHFPQLEGQITTYGVPHTAWDARQLARRDHFEFEKWVCGAIGAEGMFREPGARGADGGVDGIFEIYPVHLGQKAKSEYVIVQVKGGKVTPDAVRALYASVRHYDVRAGVLVCFEEQLRTVENQRNKETFRDSLGEYPVIQGYSVEALLAHRELNLPRYGRRRGGARLA
ncbi:MAG: DNA methyltransferase [Anaerolineaceae bacterium]|nr:DNA methyltransferase [Anaerolineaceae bacterium]